MIKPRMLTTVTTWSLLVTLSLAGQLQAQLIAHYTFDDADVEGVVVKDISGNGLNGLAVNGGPMFGVPGRIGQAASFGGGGNNEDNHYIDLSEHVDIIGVLSEGTLAAWIKPVTTEEAGGAAGHLTDVLTIFAASDSTQPSSEMRWVVHTATSPFAAGGPGGAVEHGSMYLGTRGVDFSDHLISDMAAEVSLLDGQWHHVAVTVDGDNFGRLFIDGNEADSYYLSGLDAISFIADILPDGPDTLSIGRNKDNTAGGGQWFYHGLIDDFRIYSEALSADAIQQLFNEATTGTPGDFDGNGSLDITDLDLLSAEILAGTNSATFDMNGDSLVNGDDLKQYVESPDLLNTWIGDANLDGEFNSSDFVAVFGIGLYETGNPATWAGGDWNADEKFDSGDFVAAFTSGGYENGPRAAVASVPEPSGIVLMLLGSLTFRGRRRLDK
jgi:hypothetical protein